ncbi:hypothetical protein [Nocardioides luteus]|uniref:hypothetical protein n=1 Tax=Nocardioides luteus TaxID=1844 RepID=UPI0018CA8B24|nr:hypothetical protein [Nocardioides luteus]MBG6096688.1 hypothetical protein [Nocardioides luteus]
MEKDLLKMTGVEEVDVDDQRVVFSDVKESDLKPVADRIAEWDDHGGFATGLDGWDLISNGVVVGSEVAQQPLPNDAVAAFVELAALGLDQYTSEEIKPFGSARSDDSFWVSLKGVEDPMGVTITVLKALGDHAARYGTLSVEAPGGFHVLVGMDELDASLIGSVVTDLESLPDWSAYDGASVQVGGFNEKPNKIGLHFSVPLADTVDVNRSALAAQAKLVNPNDLFVSVTDVPSDGILLVMGTVEEVEGEVAVLEGLKDSPIASVTYIGGGADTWLVLTVKRQADLLTVAQDAERVGVSRLEMSIGGQDPLGEKIEGTPAELIKQLSR